MAPAAELPPRCLALSRLQRHHRQLCSLAFGPGGSSLLGSSALGAGRSLLSSVTHSKEHRGLERVEMLTHTSPLRRDLPAISRRFIASLMG